jgi:hypothetical protein
LREGFDLVGGAQREGERGEEGGGGFDRIASLRFPLGCLWQAISLCSIHRILED